MDVNNILDDQLTYTPLVAVGLPDISTAPTDTGDTLNLHDVDGAWFWGDSGPISDMIPEIDSHATEETEKTEQNICYGAVSLTRTDGSDDRLTFRPFRQ